MSDINSGPNLAAPPTLPPGGSVVTEIPAQGDLVVTQPARPGGKGPCGTGRPSPWR